VTVRPTRLPRALLGLALAAALPLTGCAGKDASASSSSSHASSSAPASGADAGNTDAVAEGKRIEVTISGGQVSGDTGRVQVPQDEHVSLVITTDVADQVHVHGYDLEQELAPGTPTTIEFDATVPGVFEVELHEAGTLLLTLQVG
jgi:heme/copper-type cytochrome/quinol oxidase subunit 2